MKIIIVGNGKVGYAIANSLAEEDHDIVMVDANTNALRKAESTMDVLCVEGNGASISVLIEAGVRTADLVIAVTNQDEINLVCCLIAKKLGAGHTIARVRNTDYRRDEEMLKKEIGLDMVINPDLAAAQEIARIVSTPSAFSVEPFAQGRIDMIGFDVTAQTHVAGRSLREFSSHTLAKVLFCVAVHEGEMVIPNGAFVPQIGDKLYMIGAKGQLQHMLHSLGHSQPKVKAVSILGGSRTAMYLAWELKKRGIKSQIVEMNHQKCLILSAELPDTLIIEGDGTDNELLREEGVLCAEEAESIRPAHIAAFFASPLGRRLLASETVRRELEFNYRVSARHLLGADTDEPILLQGVIDCCFLEEGAWVLLDYKTDFVPPGTTLEEAAAKHARQLTLYAEALAALTATPVREAYICLLGIDENVRLL